MEREHNGEKALAVYEAKMVSTSREHYDFVSTLMLTDQHLYVLEDNGDGSYAEYFSYEIREIDGIEVRKAESKGRAAQQVKGGFVRIFTDIVIGLTGFIRTSLLQPERQERWDRGHLIVNFHTRQGQNDSRQFLLGKQEPNDFLEAYRRLRESYLMD